MNKTQSQTPATQSKPATQIKSTKPKKPKKQSNPNPTLWQVPFRGITYFIDFELLKQVYNKIGYNHQHITQQNIKEKLRQDKLAYTEFYELISRYSIKTQGPLTLIQHHND